MSDPFDIPGLITDKSSDEDIADARNLADLMACLERANIVMNGSPSMTTRGMIGRVLSSLTAYYSGEPVTYKETPTYFWREPEGTPWGGMQSEDLERIKKSLSDGD